MNQKLKNTLINDRGLKQSSIKSYESIMKKIAFNFKVKSISTTFIKKNIDKILEFYSDKSHSKQIGVYTVFLIVLSPKEKKKPSKINLDVYNKINIKLKQMNNNYKIDKENQVKSSKEEENWVDLVTIYDFIRENETTYIKLFKLKKTQVNYFNLQKILIMKLYTEIPPRRLDYSDMIYITLKDFNNLSDEDKLKNNYFVLSKSKINKSMFWFGKLNTKSLDSSVALGVEILMGKSIEKIILLLRTHNKINNLLLNSKMKKMTKSTFSKLIQSIFIEFFNKNIGASLLRKIYISNFYKNDISLKIKKELSQKMNHSPNTASIHYRKII